MEKYEPITNNFLNLGEKRLLIDKETKETFVVVYIERGEKIDAKVEREIIKHKSLRHPNIIQLKEVHSTWTHLAIIEEYAAGGELFNRIRNAGRFSEDEARSCFQQLISGVSYCHSMEVCDRELKLENTLLDASQPPRLKICGSAYYPESEMPRTQGKRARNAPLYVAPEALSQREYDGKIADVWSCGITLYAMLVGKHPFEDPEDPYNLRQTMARILGVQYSIPDDACVSADCKDLLSRIFVADSSKRITISEIKKLLWFLKDCPKELIEGEKTNCEEKCSDMLVQSEEEIMRAIEEARTPGEATEVERNAASETLDD